MTETREEYVVESPAKYKVYIGCEEWQDVTVFDTLPEAEKYVLSHNGVYELGLYPASDGWIENLATGERTIFLADGDEPDLDYAQAARVMWTDTQTGETFEPTTAQAMSLVLADLNGERYADTPTKALAVQLASALDKAIAAVGEFGGVRDAVTLRSQARHMAEYLQERGAELAEANLISARRLKLERIIGKELLDTVRPGNPIVTGREGCRIPEGINKNQSSAWQNLARIPEPTFEDYLNHCLESETEITTGGALGLYYKLNRGPLPFEDDMPPSDMDAPDWDDGVERVVYLTCPCGCGYEGEQSKFKRRVEE